jgi:hypothetical protein
MEPSLIDSYGFPARNSTSPVGQPTGGNLAAQSPSFPLPSWPTDAHSQRFMQALLQQISLPGSGISSVEAGPQPVFTPMQSNPTPQQPQPSSYFSSCLQQPREAPMQIQPYSIQQANEYLSDAAWQGQDLAADLHRPVSSSSALPPTLPQPQRPLSRHSGDLRQPGSAGFSWANF